MPSCPLPPSFPQDYVVSRETAWMREAARSALVCPRQVALVESPGMAPVRNNSARSDLLSLEVLIVGLLTTAGAVLRFWGLPRLGLSHFDEGVHAIAGLWPVSPRGLASLDSTLIPYAPPGFPILVGVAYLGLGVSDLAAIVVSISAGSVTIPAAAWLARRTAGAGAGAAAAALVAFSGFHVACSRVALTDASLPLCWILGLVRGQRFLERPRLTSAIALGLSMGLAQWFKYNGWLLGVFVVLAALSGGPAWNVTEFLAAVLGCKLMLVPLGNPNRCRASLPLAIFALVLTFFHWWLGAGWVLDPRQRPSPGKRLPTAARLGLSILTPFYHPYARLRLPPHFLGWIMTANLINQGFPTPRPKPGKSASALETGNLYVINPWEWIARGVAMPAIELPGADMFARRRSVPVNYQGRRHSRTC